MAKTDPELGQQVHEHLIKLGLETRTAEGNVELALVELRNGVYGFLDGMGLDVDGDKSIMDTPRRVAEMFTTELCAGLNYDNFPKCTVTPNGQEVLDQEGWNAYLDSRLVAWQGQFSTREEYLEANQASVALAQESFLTLVGKVDEMVMVANINTVSLCEHHFQTISGVSHVAYIPGDKLLGLSKFARVVDFFARRPQVQERMTEQVYAALSFILGTPDVAVQQICTHNCMRARGVMDPHSKTTTSKMGGKFRDSQALREEFLYGTR
jgi:GTP cyclohydrolase I